MWHAFPGLPGGRYRRYLSLREGSEQPPEAALKEGTQTYEMAVAPVGKNPLSLAADDSRSVLAVKGPLSPLRALDCCGPIRRGWLFMREKGVRAFSAACRWLLFRRGLP